MYRKYNNKFLVQMLDIGVTKSQNLTKPECQNMAA